MTERELALRRAIFAAALGLDDATVTSDGITVPSDDGDEEIVFQVAVPARHWWDDISFT